MSEFDKEEFQFPDEVEIKGKSETESFQKEEVDTAPELEIEVEDDTPAEDRGREPLPKDIVEDLENDTLEDYSEKVKTRLKQMKKVWNDERREKEAASREREEAITVAQKILAENKALKAKLSQGEDTILESFKNASQRELDEAKRDYREAYEAGDADKLVEAQEKMTTAKLKVDRAVFAAQNRKENASQDDDFDVKIPQQRQEQPVQDQKASKWQSRNTWFGQDDEMTSLALGLHEKLVKEHGMAYATTDEYYKRIDQTMRKRFPENFEDDQNVEAEQPKRTKPSTVVASAARSTSSKKIKLTTSAQSIAKKLGLTNEQYARELIKMEA
jgi:hypothetical protein